MDYGILTVSRFDLSESYGFERSFDHWEKEVGRKWWLLLFPQVFHVCPPFRCQWKCTGCATKRLLNQLRGKVDMNEWQEMKVIFVCMLFLSVIWEVQMIISTEDNEKADKKWAENGVSSLFNIIFHLISSPSFLSIQFFCYHMFLYSHIRFLILFPL